MFDAKDMMTTAATMIALSSQAFASMPMSGKAHLSAPLVGSTLKIYDSKGALVETIDRATDRNGHFKAKLSRTLTSFTVVFTGGTHEGAPFCGELRADVAAYRPGKDLVYVNAATTMASRYHSTHPELTAGECSASVRNYLGIPTTLNLGKGLDAPEAESFFSHAEFLTKANLGGGLDAYMTELVEGVDHYSRSPSYSVPLFRMSIN